MSKENTNITLASIGADEVASHVNATTTQAFDTKMKKDSSNEESDGDDTDLDYGGDERVSVLSDKEDEEGEQTAKGAIVTPVTTEGDDAQATHTSNPGEAIGDDTAETQEEKNGDNGDKKPKGTRDGSVLHDPVVLAAGRIKKSASEHMFIRVVQQIIRVHLLTFLNLIRQNELSKIFFPTTVTCLKFLSCKWMVDTSLQGAALRDMSWFMGFQCLLFPRVHPICDFPYPGLLQLHNPKKVQAKSKDIPPIWGVYVKYPLPTKHNGGGTVTGISSKIGGPHSPDILSPYRTSTRLCPYCNQACNGRDQLLNHLRFHYHMVLVCSICAGCRSSSWRTVKGHIEACALQRPNIAGRWVSPGKPLWHSSNNKLRNLTRADMTAMTFKLPVWLNPPNDAELGDRA